MKLLASYSLKSGKKPGISGVETWRIQRPANALKNNTDWNIDESVGIFEEAKKIKNVSEAEMLKRKDYFSKYNMVWGSYHMNPFVHTFTMVIQDKIKTKFITDIDDNVFQIDSSNPFLKTVKEKHLLFLQGIAVDARYVTTTSEKLAKVLRKQRYYRPKESVAVIPNLISTDRYKPGVQEDKNKIVIGYIGGASHYDDLHKTHIKDALEKIMHEYKNVYVTTVGISFDEYLPKARYTYLQGADGADKWYDFYPTLKFDIGIAPLKSTPFTECKSNIKWQEYSLMGIPTIASKVGPYEESIQHGSTGYLVDNTMDDWYKAFKLMIENETFRRKIGEKAKQDVIDNWSLENNWHKIKDGLDQLNSLDIKD